MIRNTYTPLDHISLPSHANITLADPTNKSVLKLDSPAFEAMTDLRRHHPVSVRPEETLEQARINMIVSGVRLLFVRGLQGELRGLITATDLAGERAIQRATSAHLSMGEITVSDVMTGVLDLELLDFQAVAKAEVGHIVATLQKHGRQHALVVNRLVDGDMQIVGIFSTTQIARQMGIPVVDHVKAHTFAQLRAVVATT